MPTYNNSIRMYATGIKGTMISEVFVCEIMDKCLYIAKNGRKVRHSIKSKTVNYHSNLTKASSFLLERARERNNKKDIDFLTAITCMEEI